MDALMCVVYSSNISQLDKLERSSNGDQSASVRKLQGDYIERDLTKLPKIDRKILIESIQLRFILLQDYKFDVSPIACELSLNYSMLRIGEFL